MDPRDRAETMLAHAQERQGGVVTPLNQSSHMDAEATERIPHAVVRAADGDPDEEADTDSMPAPGAAAALTGEPVTVHEVPGVVPTTRTEHPRRISIAERLSGLG
jgi:hypothetical protein